MEKEKQTIKDSCAIRESSAQVPLAEAVSRFNTGQRCSFHVPGHKSSESLNPLSDYFGQNSLRCDLTELPDLDDLHHPSGVIAEAEQMAADLFGADQTFFLVNGTTSGITASVAAVSSDTETVILERNTHECTTRGLILSGAGSCFIPDYYDRETGLSAGISPEAVKDAIRKCFSPSAVVVTHPSYYGTYSDLREIVRIAHNAGIPVIADEAHGAQLIFTGQEGIPSSLEAGADIVVQSTHKMLGSLTQSAMLHVQGTLVDRERLRFYINFMNTTSPSYLLMSSLDLVRSVMETQGWQIWNRITDLVRLTGDELNRIKGIYCPSLFTRSGGEKHNLERTRLLISAWEHGLTGSQLGNLLKERYGIDVEFTDLRYAVALAGTGNTEKDFERLIKAVGEIARIPAGSLDPLYVRQSERYEKVFLLRPESEMKARDAVIGRSLRLDGTHAEGSASARDISLYPPGIPVIRAGEVFSSEVIKYIEEGISCGMEFHGIAGTGEDGRVRFFCTENPLDLSLLNGFF